MTVQGSPDLCEWLEARGLEAHADAFEREQVSHMNRCTDDG